MVFSTFTERIQFIALLISLQFMRTVSVTFSKMSLGYVLKEAIKRGSIIGSVKSEIHIKIRFKAGLEPMLTFKT